MVVYLLPQRYYQETTRLEEMLHDEVTANIPVRLIKNGADLQQPLVAAHHQVASWRLVILSFDLI
jgi:hypothetical protein